MRETSVYVYDSIIDSVQELDPAIRGEVYMAVVEYLKYRREPDYESMSQIARVLFISNKPNLDYQIERAESGRRGGKQRASKAQATAKLTPSKAQADAKLTPSYDQATAKLTPSEKEREKEREKPSANAEGKKSAARFVPPTPEEVDAYIAERGYTGFTGQQLVDHYEANGWRRGNTPIKDWRACVRTWWNQRQRDGGRSRASPQATPEDFAAYDLQEG
ncbi:MAG: hypothetical protein IKN60_04575 [Bacteroidales bacterium]|nr:hypothetical protein [Bacteroidales bacterium]